MEDHDLETLLQTYRNGDTDALGRIVDLTRRPLHRFIQGLVRDPHTADDVFQDVWFRAVRGLHRYESDRLLSWLFRIARNRVIDLSRKKKPDVSLQQPMGSGEQAVALESFVAETRPGPDRNSSNRELAQRIQAAVDTLPPEQREVYLMRSEADIPFKQIAEHQGVSINTALARMQYALRRLREALAEDYEQLKSLPGSPL
jgi:RNA polymerase sigma-70 factor (ECF subfamily)